MLSTADGDGRIDFLGRAPSAIHHHADRAVEILNLGDWIAREKDEICRGTFLHHQCPSHRTQPRSGVACKFTQQVRVRSAQPGRLRQDIRGRAFR
jgi:hypothetical protein